MIGVTKVINILLVRTRTMEIIGFNIMNKDVPFLPPTSGSSDLKHRKVKHFGYEFQYGSNKINPDEPITPIPEEYQFLQMLFKKYHNVPYKYDQLTINHYLPGQGRFAIFILCRL